MSDEKQDAKVEREPIDIKSTFDLLTLDMAPHGIASQLPLADEKLVPESVSVIANMLVSYSLESRWGFRHLQLLWTDGGFIVNHLEVVEKADAFDRWGNEKFPAEANLGSKDRTYLAFPQKDVTPALYQAQVDGYLGLWERRHKMDLLEKSESFKDNKLSKSNPLFV